MKDISDTLEYKGQKYPIIFNLNVLEAIQEEYGTFSAWLDKIYKDDDDETEPDIKAIKFAYYKMINEGIRIENKTAKEKREFLDKEDVGEIITEIGLKDAFNTLNSLAQASNQPGEDAKNE